MNAWQKVIWLDERNAELLKLLWETLEHIEDPNMASPLERGQLEEKIRDALIKEDAI